VIVVPVGCARPGLPSPLRLALLLGAGPVWINQPAFDRWHRFWGHLWPGADRADQELALGILQAVRRDPGRRVLVTVRIERRPAVMDGLCHSDEVVLVPRWRGRHDPPGRR
jgi:hypothetical protein